MKKRPLSVLFVCSGNVCRSPMAEFLFKKLVCARHDWVISSAGLAAVDGMPASAPAIAAMAEIGIDIASHRSRFLRPELVDANDLIIVMTDFQKQTLAAWFPRAAKKIFCLTSFDKKGKQGGIPDPIGASLDTYRAIRDQINEELLDVVLFLEKREKASECT